MCIRDRGIAKGLRLTIKGGLVPTLRGIAFQLQKAGKVGLLSIVLFPKAALIAGGEDAILGERPTSLK